MTAVCLSPSVSDTPAKFLGVHLVPPFVQVCPHRRGKKVAVAAAAFVLRGAARIAARHPRRRLCGRVGRRARSFDAGVHGAE